MRQRSCARLVLTAMLLLVWSVAPAQNVPEGQPDHWLLDAAIAPSYLDPAEVAGLATLCLLYALHDAMIKPLPGIIWRRAWRSPGLRVLDGLVYEFTLRQGVHFHNGDPFTAADVQLYF